MSYWCSKWCKITTDHHLCTSLRGAMGGGYGQNHMLLVAVGGSQWAYLRIATSNHTATRHHFVAIVLFDFSFNQYTSSSWNLKGKLWETTQRFAWKKKILPPIVNTSPSGFVLFFKTKKTAGEAPTVKFVLKKKERKLYKRLKTVQTKQQSLA